MSFEDIKQSIEQDLISNGFHKENDDLIRVDVQQRQIVINGVSNVQEVKQEIKFSCIGEGSVDSTPSAGFAMYINGFNVTDLWCASLEDFKYLIQKL